MPANLTPQYRAAEERYRSAHTNQEKLRALDEMMSTIPKHKGTEKLQADIRKRISKLKAEGLQKSSGGKRVNLFQIEKVGAGQIALLGPPNSGKSSLLASLTNTSPEIADYPGTTRKPMPGMMAYENIQVQLIDTPALTDSYYEPWLPDIMRRCDALAVVLDLASDSLLDDVEKTLAELEGNKIKINEAEPVREGEEEDYDFDQYRKPGILIGNKLDADGAADNLAILKEFFEARFTIAAVSTIDSESLNALRAALFRALGAIRVYTKIPGRDPDMTAPYILPLGSTLLDAAEGIHKDFAQKLRYARIWGSDLFQGQMVHKDFVLRDGDIIELHL
jgi:small GTP-binding protein